MARGPIGYATYRALTTALTPLAPLLLRRRIGRGKEDKARVSERLGRDLPPRPEGTLVWVHGASVGECIAALPLIGELLRNPSRNVLVTSGTVTSAQMMAEPLIGSGTATAAASLTSPVARSRASISAGPVRLPAILIVSSERP